jgi:hypothetical protein
MARYFFHTDNGDHLEDELGTDLPNLEAARAAASKLICEMVSEGVIDIWPNGGLTVTVADEGGLTLAVLEVSATTTMAPGARAGV